MRPSLVMDLATGMSMVPTPSLVAYAQMLALPGLDLDNTVAQELAENPALVDDGVALCGTCGLPLRDRWCAGCGDAPGLGGVVRVQTHATEAPFAGELADCAEPTVADLVAEELRLLLPANDAPIVALVVGSLDDRGYLTEDAGSLARITGEDEARIARVIATLRSSGPPGVGARDARDCLLLQLGRLEADGTTQSLATAIVADHLAALARGALASIGRTMGVTIEEVVDAREFIRRELHPHPSLPSAAASACDGHRAIAVRPDLAVVERTDPPAGFDVDILEERRYALRVETSFRRLSRCDEQVGKMVRQADFFLARLRERWATLRRVLEHVVGREIDFFREGSSGFVPLTRVGVAAALGVHSSTVGRAVAGKHVMLPTGRVIPFADFFDGALAVRAQLQEIISNERRPLSDSELCERLAASGQPVARRTVAKYRDQLRILPSTNRWTAS
jgi:RNA polymerase sigma-54 factor